MSELYTRYHASLRAFGESFVVEDYITGSLIAEPAPHSIEPQAYSGLRFFI